MILITSIDNMVVGEIPKSQYNVVKNAFNIILWPFDLFLSATASTINLYEYFAYNHLDYMLDRGSFIAKFRCNFI